MGVREIAWFLEQLEMSARDLRLRMSPAPTPWEPERLQATSLLSPGWTATAAALDQDLHTS